MIQMLKGKRQEKSGCSESELSDAGIARSSRIFRGPFEDPRGFELESAA